MRRVAFIGLTAISLACTSAHAAPIQTVFVVAMENHNFTQPTGLGTSPEQLFNNPAASYLNSLITPGNANAQYTSYFSNMTNVGAGIHPSEPITSGRRAGPISASPPTPIPAPRPTISRPRPASPGS